MLALRDFSAHSHLRLVSHYLSVAKLHRLMVVAASVTGLLGIGFVVLQLQTRGALLPMMAVCAMSLGVLTIIRPSVGLVALILCATSVRVSVGTGSESPIVASLGVACLLLACWTAHQLLHRRRLNMLPSYVAYPSILLVAFTGFSMVWGRLMLDPRIIYLESFLRVQIAATILVVVSIGLLFIGADLLRSRSNRNVITSALIVTGFFALPFRAMDMSVPVLNTRGLFGLWFVAICWANALVNHRLPQSIRIVLAAGAIGWLLMAIIVEGAWVSGWLPGLLAFGIVTIWARPRWGVTLALGGAVLVAIYFSFVYDFVVVQQEADGSLGGDFGRLALWERNLTLLKDQLLFGTGPAGYALYYITFVPDQAMSTHSNWFDVLAQMGVFGFLSFVGLFIGLWILARQTMQRLVQPDDVATGLAAMSAIPAVAVSLFLGDWLIPFVYNQTIAGFDHSVYSWLMFAILSGLYAQEHYGQQRDS